LPCVVKKRTAKIFYRALSDAAHGKGASPCKMLPCALCRAPRQKTHGKGFAVRFKAFAVRSGRTAKPLFPVVSWIPLGSIVLCKGQTVLISGRDQQMGCINGCRRGTGRIDDHKGD
jgi:hypothetical protein